LFAALSIGKPELTDPKGVAATGAQRRTELTAVWQDAGPLLTGCVGLRAIDARGTLPSTLRIGGVQNANAERIAAAALAIHLIAPRPGIGRRNAVLIGADLVGREAILAVDARGAADEARLAELTFSLRVTAARGARRGVAHAAVHGLRALLVIALAARAGAVFAHIEPALRIRRTRMAFA
jgi:hypothetical protein